MINNNAVIISDQLTISIGKFCLIGLNFNVINSDFHGIEKNARRGQESVRRKDVTIGDNVFVGNNVSILKGVIVGNNVVIANGSIVTKSIPDNAIVGGNPARIIRYL
ncbi:TPA: acyltransferase [Aeromonas salmonicida subsp. pectinolytica]|uniref:acyltransferase n=1 Tax=Aeromonas salmonicida TaxID=645 RepID=UPI0038D37981